MPKRQIACGKWCNTGTRIHNYSHGGLPHLIGGWTRHPTIFLQIGTKEYQRYVLSEFDLPVASIICLSAQPLAFPAPRCVDVSQNISKLKVLGLTRLTHNGASKMDFNLVVMLPTRRLRVPLEMSSLSNHQCKNKLKHLKLFFLFYGGCKGRGKGSYHGEHSWCLVPKAWLLSHSHV